MAVFTPGAYRAIFRVREAYTFDTAALLMRLYTSMLTIGTVSMLTLAGYSFFMAGLASSVIALTSFVAAPRIAKLIDERGQSRIVPIASVITTVGLVVMLINVGVHGPEWILFVAAIFMGCIPSPQALTRARWTYLIRAGRLGKAAPELRTMFSYEGILDDLSFTLGPAFSIALAAAIAPIAGMLAGGIAFVVGAIMLVSSKSTEPIPGWKPSDNAGASKHGEGKEKTDTRGTFTTQKGEDTSGSDSKQSAAKSVFRTSALVRVLFVLMLFLGAFYGVFDTATVSLAEDLNNPNIASVVLMVAGAVSMTMGLVFGMLRLAVAPHTQLVVTAVLVGSAYGAMCLIESAESLFVVSTLGALFFAPFLITANATCERAVPSERLTEAFAWIQAGATCGGALGPTAAGIVVDQIGTFAGFDFGAILSFAIPVTALVCFPIIKRHTSRMK